MRTVSSPASAGRQGYAIWPPRLRALMAGNQDVFHCPSRPDEFRWGSGAVPSAPATALYTQFGYEPGEPMLDWLTTPFSYGYNEYGTGGNSGEGDGRGLGGAVMPDRSLPTANRDRELRAGKVRRPSEMIAIADSDSDGMTDFVIRSFSGASPGDIHLPASIHKGGANVLFCDGHVQWYAQKQLTLHGVAPADPKPMLSMWNNDNRT